MTATRIKKQINSIELTNLLDTYKSRVKVNSHAYFRISQMQRKIYKEETLITMLTQEKPVLVGIQENNNYAIFFSKKNGYMRLIFKVTKENIEIITFYITDHLPKI